jgi:hypothetical protein
VVVGVVGAVTLGINVSIKHHGELTLKCKFARFICIVARARVLSLLPSSFEPGLQNYLFCVILQHLPELALPRLSSRACAFVRLGMTEFALYYCLLPLFILPVCNSETVNANCQAELINSSLLGVSCVLQDCLLACSVCATDLPSIANFLAFCALLAICRFPSPFQGIGTAPTYYAPEIFTWGLVCPSSPFQVTEIPRATPCSYVTFLLYLA